MASTIIIYEGDGTRTDFTIPFDYLKKSFVTVRLDPSTTLTGGDYGDTGSDYYFLDKTTIRLKVAPASGESLTIRRHTSATERVVTFKDASILKATDLDTSQMQAFHIAEEGRDAINDAIIGDKEGNWDAKGHRIINVGTPIKDNDAVNLEYYKKDVEGVYQARLNAEKARDAAKVSEDNAKASEVASKDSENASKASEISASDSASLAKDWAIKLDDTVDGSEYSSKYYANSSSSSANVASDAETQAKEAEKNATAQAADAKSSAQSAQNSASSASTSEGNAKVSEDNAKASEVASKDSENASKASEISASDSASLAKDWAIKLDDTVDGSEYSSKYYANSSSSSANVASDAETQAKEAEKNATAQAADAKSSAQSAQNSASSASTSAGNAKVSEANAEASEVASKASENASKASEIKSTQEADRAESEADRAKSEADRAKGYAEQATAGQVQTDWNQTDSTQKDYIKNKPTIPTKVSQLSNDLGYLTKDISEVISAPGASFTGDVSATTVNATSLAVTGESNLGFTRIRDAGNLIVESAPVKGLGITADLTDGTYGAVVSVRNVNDPYVPGGIRFSTRSPESGISTNHTMEFRNDGSLRIDGDKVSYVYKTWNNGTNWYRKWSNGWHEQGGYVKSGGNNTAFYTGTFNTPFTTTKITLVATNANGNNNNSQWQGQIGAFVVSATQFKETSYTSDPAPFYWYACGY